jgi:hypothetical protein
VIRKGVNNEMIRRSTKDVNNPDRKRRLRRRKECIRQLSLVCYDILQYRELVSTTLRKSLVPH